MLNCVSQIEQIKAYLMGAESTLAKDTGRRPRQEQAMILDRAADSKDGLKLERPTGKSSLFTHHIARMLIPPHRPNRTARLSRSYP